MTDNRMIIATVVGTGIAMTTVIMAFVGIILQEEMRELRALVIDAIKGADPTDNDQ